MNIYNLFTSKTKKIKDTNGNIKPNSIASLEKVELGGMKQSILIRGHDQNNPILLFLHGGPGSSEMIFARGFQSKIEEHFIVVNWDQRGSGKSYSRKIPKDSMNVNQFISDAYELVELLKKRYNKEKIYIIGHSWGTVIGLKLAKNYPDLFYAYIGMGQLVNIIDNEKISFQFTLEEAKKRGDEKAIKKLENLNPPYKENPMECTKQRTLLTKYDGGIMHNKPRLKPILKKAIKANEYSLRDYIRFFSGMLFSIKIMWSELIELNFFEEITEIKIPIYIISGRYDYQVPFELAKKLFDQIEAPLKKFVWFENSAHCPNFEEPDKFDELLISQILPETIGN
ncbi:MAG: alpha/beta hydrolase [archaeon]|nr:alpha/beta hydrolase [archaeon]